MSDIQQGKGILNSQLDIHETEFPIASFHFQRIITEKILSQKSYAPSKKQPFSREIDENHWYTPVYILASAKKPQTNNGVLDIRSCTFVNILNVRKMFGKYKLGRHLKNLKNSDRRNFFDPSFSTWKNDSRIMRWFFKITGLLRTGGSFWNGAIGIKGGYVDAGIYKNFSLKCPFFHVIQ